MPKNFKRWFVKYRTIKAYNFEQETDFAPTTFQWQDCTGKIYYFRLRFGGWTLRDLTDENDWSKIIACGFFGDEWNGYCTEKDMIKLLRKNGVKLKIISRR